jgi:hypothetical protein
MQRLMTIVFLVAISTAVSRADVVLTYSPVDLVPGQPTVVDVVAQDLSGVGFSIGAAGFQISNADGLVSIDSFEWSSGLDGGCYFATTALPSPKTAAISNACDVTVAPNASVVIARLTITGSVNAQCGDMSTVSMSPVLFDGDDLSQIPILTGQNVAFDFVFSQADCNGNLIPDGCEIASGDAADVNQNQIPDECEQVSIAPASSRFLFVTPDLSAPFEPTALRIRNLCTGEMGWLSLRDVDHDDGPTGIVNVAITLPTCDPAEFRTPQQWLGTGGRLLATGEIVAPETLFELVIVSGSCNAPIESAPLVTTACTWPYADTDNSGPPNDFGGDLQRIFDNLPSVVGLLGWRGPDPGFTIDIQGPTPQDVPDGNIGFGTDLSAVFESLPASGAQAWLGPTCPLGCP